MFNFMFGVLGSVMFWALYFGATLFVGTLVLKRLSPNTFSLVTTGSSEDGRSMVRDGGEIIGIILAAYVGWPLVVLVWLMAWITAFIFETIVWRSFCHAVKFANRNTPDITIRRNNKEPK